MHGEPAGTCLSVEQPACSILLYKSVTFLYGWRVVVHTACLSRTLLAPMQMFAHQSKEMPAILLVRLSRRSLANEVCTVDEAKAVYPFMGE